MGTELTPLLGSQPAGDRSQPTGGGLSLLSGRPAITFSAAEHLSPDYVAY